jgi:hypothetical protein
MTMEKFTITERFVAAGARAAATTDAREAAAHE